MTRGFPAAQEISWGQRDFPRLKVNPGVWFETLFIIFINVLRIDIICIFSNFWDIIHYFCQIQALFKWIRHYLSKLIWICAETASFSPEITLSILGSSRTQPGLQSAPSRIQMGQICPFVANQDMLRLCAFLDIIYEKYTLFFKFKTLLLYWETLFVQLPNHRAAFLKMSISISIREFCKISISIKYCID